MKGPVLIAALVLLAVVPLVASAESLQGTSSLFALKEIPNEVKHLTDAELATIEGQGAQVIASCPGPLCDVTGAVFAQFPAGTRFVYVQNEGGQNQLIAINPTGAVFAGVFVYHLGEGTVNITSF
jgi:hypothetical protein